MVRYGCLVTLAMSIAACQPAEMREPLAAPPPATVAAEREPTDVLAFAQGACGDCHSVEPPALSPNPKAPAFADIANRGGLTAETLSQWLRDAHNYPEAMDFDLETSQVEALTAYILTLGDPDYRPPTY